MPTAARAAKNEGIFRIVNEQIRTIVERFSAAEDDEMFSFVCECSRSSGHGPKPACEAPQRTTRRDPNREARSGR
jgi:hypothetical protein